MARHRIFVEFPLHAARSGEVVVITGDEARHAAGVKRLASGEEVELLDGRGTLAFGAVREVSGGTGGKAARREASLAVEIAEVRGVPRPRPELHILSATPKGERIEEMIDALSQIGAAAWSPLATARGVVSPREHKLVRAQRVAIEAAKQCGRAWLMEIDGAETPFADAAAPEPGTRIIIADASGERYTPRTAHDRVRLLIGPEGGFTPDELDAARIAGAEAFRFGIHTMRIETAAVAAAAVIMHGG